MVSVGIVSHRDIFPHEHEEADPCHYIVSTVELIEMKSSGSRDWRPGNADRVLYSKL